MWATPHLRMKFALVDGHASPARETRALPVGFVTCAYCIVSQAAFAEINASDCERAAKYSESRRGSAVLVMQNGRTIFEHYANGGSANRRWPIFSGTKSFGELQRSRLCKRACLDSTIRCRTRSPSGKVIRGNHRSRFGNCLAKPTALRARRIFSGLRFAIETRWRSDCPVWLNLVRLLFTAQVTSRFFRNCCVENSEGAALSATSKRTWRAGLDCAISNTKRRARQSAACDRL